MIDEEKAGPVRLLGVAGYQDRSNDVVYCGPRLQNEGQDTVVYFGGDIQDFKESMESHRDNKNYVTWSLDNTALILQATFPNSHIIVVRPSKMEYKTFSCFQNFVPSGNCGVPHHIQMHHCLQHLDTLIANIGNQVNKPLNHDLTIIGFSKGCVVLNQCLYEFSTMKEKDEFVSRIKNMFWLDGGHSGGKNTWVTSKPLLQTLANFGINVHIHVSPYQVQDDRRPWIKKEEKIFYTTLRNFNACVQRRVHFGDLPPSIVQHFSILNEFYEGHSTEDGT
ncbi:mitochondrial protein C2orf69 homolog isoform X2 [Zophobas morio]